MTSARPDLVGLVAARICHDMANPLGAIGNGVDLMRELGEAAPEDVAIVGEAQARAVALLGFHRLAFGAAPADGAPVERSEIAARCDMALAARRTRLSWSGIDGRALSRPMAKLVVLMVTAARHLGGRDCTIETEFAPLACNPVSVVARGEGAMWDPEVSAIFEGTAVSDARRVEFALLPVTALSAGATLTPIREPGAAGFRSD